MTHRVSNAPTSAQMCQSLIFELAHATPADSNPVAPAAHQPETRSQSQSQSRSSKSDSLGPEAYARETKNGYEAGASAMRHKTDAMDSSLLSASVRTGGQTEIAASLAKLRAKASLGGASIKLNAEALSVVASAGTENADGSTGLNAKAAATLVGAELTVGNSGNSFTFGLALGPAGEQSAGWRDADNDGLREYCHRESFGPVTIGSCTEEPPRGL